MTIVEFRIGDVLQLRKQHPCGGSSWTVVRLGADVGLVCTTCNRRVLLPRSTLERRIKRFLERGPKMFDSENQEVVTADSSEMLPRQPSQSASGSASDA